MTGILIVCWRILNFMLIGIRIPFYCKGIGLEEFSNGLVAVFIGIPFIYGETVFLEGGALD